MCGPVFNNSTGQGQQRYVCSDKSPELVQVGTVCGLGLAPAIICGKVPGQKLDNRFLQGHSERTWLSATRLAGVLKLTERKALYRTGNPTVEQKSDKSRPFERRLRLVLITENYRCSESRHFA